MTVLNLIARLRSSPLIGNLAKVTSGTIAAQAIMFAFSPIITRLYGPEAFGIQGVFLSLVAILSPAIALRYPMAIIVENSDENARRLGRLSLQIAFAFGCLFFAALLLCRQPIAAMIGAESLGLLIYFMPLALFCTAWQEVRDCDTARRNDFGLAARVSVIQVFLTNLARTVGGIFAPLASTLVAVTSLAPAVQAALLARGARRTDIEPTADSGALEAKSARALLKTYRDFPLFRVPNDVLNSASQSVPVILFASLFSPHVAGLYALTRTVLNLPFNIVGASAGNVLYRRFAELALEGRSLAPLIVRSTLAFATLTPIIVGVSFFFPEIFAFLFGDEWRDAGHYGQWLSLWIAVGFANLPTVRVAPVIRAQHLMLAINCLMLASRVLAIVVGFKLYNDPLTSIALFSVVSAIGNLILILTLVLATRRFDRRRLKDSSYL